jgi:hypothetical protein
MSRKPAPAKQPRAASKAARSAPRAPQALKVTGARVQGFQVFTSPVRPRHRTPEQIAAAIATLD